MSISVFDLLKNDSLSRQVLTLAHHGRSASYERLEFLGDRVIGLIVADLLYERFSKDKEGKLAIRFTDLVREETLADVSRLLGLPDQLITNEPELRQNNSILADVCEALLGALYLEKGLEAVKAFVKPIWDPLIDQEREAIKDSKSALQEWAQTHRKNLPIYTILEKTGPDHNPFFKIQVEVRNIGFGIGSGHSKKEAQQEAAHCLLKKIETKSPLPKKGSKE